MVLGHAGHDRRTDRSGHGLARAAPLLQALVGDVVIESRQVEGQKRPEMVAKFTIDGIPALAALDRGKAAGANDPTVGLWESVESIG